MSSQPPDQWRPPQPGAPDQGPPPGPPLWGQQQPLGPPNRGGGIKWVLGAVVVVVVVAVSVGATLLFTGGNSNDTPPTVKSSPPSTAGVASDIASANDKGPVKVITEDPTCAPWTPINDTLADRQSNGWRNRDPAVPSVAWSADVRAIFREVGTAFDAAADQTVPLAKLTPHRVMRELYEQFIAYARAYADSIPGYTARDNHLANVAVSTTYVLINICNAAENDSAAARGPLVSPADTPTITGPPTDPSRPRQFLTSVDPVCLEWTSMVADINLAVADWARTDPGLPVDQWSTEQQALTKAVTPALRQNADAMQALGERSDNPVLQDFAILAAIYQRAFLQALPTYGPNDQYLYNTAAQTEALINAACLAVEK